MITADAPARALACGQEQAPGQIPSAPKQWNLDVQGCPS